MSDKLEETLAEMAEKSNEQQSQILQQQNQIADLIEAIKLMPGVQNPVAVNVQPAPIDQAVVRAEKVQRLSINMRKSNRIKVFKASNDSDIRKFIKKFGEELKSLKPMVGIDDALTKEEYVPIFRASLDFDVLERVEQVFNKDAGNIKTWGDIAIDDLHKLMVAEFGVKHTDVANVLKQFGPSRLTKSSDKSVQEFYFELCQNIPEIMKPTNPDEYKAFADLIHRAMYYISLNDTYLQKALSDLKDPTPKLQSYFDETIAAESRRKCFNDIATTSSTLDSKGGSPFQNGMRLIFKIKSRIIKRQMLQRVLGQRANKSLIYQKTLSSKMQKAEIMAKIKIKIQNKIWNKSQTRTRIRMVTKSQRTKVVSVIIVKLRRMIPTIVGI